MKSTIFRSTGASLVEFALLLALIALVAVVAVRATGKTTKCPFYEMACMTTYNRPGWAPGCAPKEGVFVSCDTLQECINWIRDNCPQDVGGL